MIPPRFSEARSGEFSPAFALIAYRGHSYQLFMIREAFVPGLLQSHRTLIVCIKKLKRNQQLRYL